MLIKPRKLRSGDQVAAVTLSWGGPGAIPSRYKAGKTQFEKEFGLTVVEMEHTLADPIWLAHNPAARAEDLMAAFADDSIKGIISTIGGDDSIRLIPFLDLDLIKKNPKVFVGYSDTTISHLACFKAGLSSFYGPSFMAGFAENGGIHSYLSQSFRNILFAAEPPGIVSPNTVGWTAEWLDWDVPENQSNLRHLNQPTGWHFLQGSGTVSGHLLGGCLEVLEWLRGTALWPSPDQWTGAILFLETSEEAVPPLTVKRALRVYAAEGILERISAILFGRPGGGIDPDLIPEYDRALLDVVSDEQGLVNMPIVTRMDFGHTDPIMTLPYGIQAELDCMRREFRIVESAVTD